MMPPTVVTSARDLAEVLGPIATLGMLALLVALGILVVGLVVEHRAAPDFERIGNAGSVSAAWPDRAPPRRPVTVLEPPAADPPMNGGAPFSAAGQEHRFDFEPLRRGLV